MKPLRRLLPIALCTTVFTGCGIAPTEESVEREVDEAAAQQVPETPSVWAMAAKSGDIEGGWIETFEDPALSALVIEAQNNNLDLAAAIANVERAQALARQAGAALLPDVSLAASGARLGSVDTSDLNASNFDLGAQVSWEADVWGRVRSQSRGAQASARAAEADLRAAQQSLAAATAKAYFSAIEANVQVGIARETAEILAENQRIVEAKYENGLASAQDAALSRSDLATARERLTALEGSYRDAVRALEALLGRYPGAELEVREALPEVPSAPPAGLPSELLERQPNLVAAERRVAAAFNATNQARAARLPTISLTGNLGGASSSLSELLDPANVAWTAGASLLAPLFDGGRRREAVEIATAEQKAALATYGQAAITAFAEVEGTLDQGVVLERRIVDLKEAVTQAERAFSVAKLRYEEGEEELINLLTIQQRVIGAQSSLSSARRLLLEQRVNLHLALGGSWEL